MTSTSDELPENKWFRFVPQDDITAKEVADILVALAWAIDYSVYIRLPEVTRRNFIEKEFEELRG